MAAEAVVAAVQASAHPRTEKTSRAHRNFTQRKIRIGVRDMIKTTVKIDGMCSAACEDACRVEVEKSLMSRR